MNFISTWQSGKEARKQNKPLCRTFLNSPDIFWYHQSHHACFKDVGRVSKLVNSYHQYCSVSDRQFAGNPYEQVRWRIVFTNSIKMCFLIRLLKSGCNQYKETWGWFNGSEIDSTIHQFQDSLFRFCNGKSRTLISYMSPIADYSPAKCCWISDG